MHIFFLVFVVFCFCFFCFFLFFSIAVLSSLVCILDVQFSLTHKLQKNVKGPDAVARCCVPVWEVWRGWTCGKHNQPDDKMSDHPTGFPDLLVWQIEGEEITAWLGTSSFFFSRCRFLLSFSHANFIYKAPRYNKSYPMTLFIWSMSRPYPFIHRDPTCPHEQALGYSSNSDFLRSIFFLISTLFFIQVTS